MCYIFPELWLPLDFPLCAASAFLCECVCIVVVSVTGKELENVGLDVPCAVLGLERGIMQRL